MKNYLLSLFRNYRDMKPTEITLEDIVGLIRHDAGTAARTQSHRYYLQQQRPQAASREKSACPCFAVSVHFNGGKRKEHIDSPYDNPVDYTNIFAQAYALTRNGFHYWLDDEEIRTLNLHNRQFEVPCLEQELILTHYRRPMEGEACIFVTNAQILARINAGLRHGLSPVKIGMVMSQEGFQQVRAGGKRGYRVVELTGDEIYRNQQAMGRFT